MARIFDGLGDRIDIANESAFDREFNQPSSISSWCWLGANAGGVILGKEDPGVTLRGWNLFARAGASSPSIAFEICSDNSGPDLRAAVRTTSEWPLSTWMHVLATYSGSGTAAGMNLYVNGVAQSLTTIIDALAGNTILNDTIAQIGARQGPATPGFFYTGRIDETAFWTSERTAADAVSLAAGVHAADLGTTPVSVWGMRRDLTNEPDLVGANNGTFFGTTFTSDAPPQLSRRGGFQ